MKHYEEVARTGTITVVAKRTCDLCGVESRSGNDWIDRSFQTRETTLTYQHGDDVYLDYSDLVEESFDICPLCWKEKLVPWMASQGATPQIKDLGY